MGPESRYGLMCVMFVSTFGLFNIAAAIFLERTMEYAADRQAIKQQRRLENDEVWVASVHKLLKKIQHHVQEETPAMEGNKASLVSSSESLRSLQFTREALDGIVKSDHEAQQILDQLDIDPQEHYHLADIVDMDNSGIMTPSQLILALRRLRGSARHGEIVKVDLMVRALQIKIDAVWAWTQAASGQDTASAAASGQVQI